MFNKYFQDELTYLRELVTYWRNGFDWTPEVS